MRFSVSSIRLKRAMKLGVAFLILCAGKHAPDTLSARLQAIESSVKTVRDYATKNATNATDFFNRLNNLPKEFRNVKYTSKTPYVDELVGMMNNWAYQLRDASVKLHPEREEKDDKTATRYAALASKYLLALSEFHSVFAKAAHLYGVRQHGVSFNQIDWLKLRIARPVARKMQAALPQLGRHAGSLNRVPLIEYGTPALAKMAQEQSAIDDPTSREGYAKLVQFSAVQEMMTNRWALNRMNSLYGWTDKAPDRCTNDFMAFNGIHLYDELWNADRYTDFMEFLPKFQNVALAATIADQKFYREMIIGSVSDLQDMKVYVEANRDPDPAVQEKNLSAFFDNWAAATISNEQGVLDKDNINDVLLLSSFAEDSFTPNDIATRVSETLFEWRKAAAISQVYGYYQNKIASQVELYFADQAGINDLNILEKRLHKALDAKHDAFINSVKPKILSIANNFDKENYQRSRTEARFEAKVDELLTYALPGMIALTELSTVSTANVKEENYFKTSVPYNLTLAPANPAELKTYFNAKVESPQGAFIKNGFKLVPIARKHIDDFFDSITARYKKLECGEKKNPTDACSIGRIAAEEADKFVLSFTHERARERNLQASFDKAMKLLGGNQQKPKMTLPKKMVFDPKKTANCHAVSDKPIYVPTVDELVYGALELVHLNRLGSAPANPGARPWSTKSISLTRPQFNSMDIARDYAPKRDNTTVATSATRYPLPPQKPRDPSSEDPFSNRDIKASEFTNRDLIRTVGDHRLYANTIVTVVYTMSPMFRIESESGQRFSSDPSHYEAQVRWAAVRDSMATASFTPEERGYHDRRKKRMGGSNGQFVVTLNLLERLALAYDPDTRTVDKRYAKEKVQAAIGSARTAIVGKLEDFCAADPMNWKNDARFKKLFEAASATRFAIVEVEKNDYKKEQLRKWDDEMRKELRSFSEAILEDWLDPIMTVFFYVSMALLLISIAAGNVAGFAVFMLCFDILWSGVGATSSYYKTRLNFYELPERVAYNLAVATSQIEGEGIADWGTVLRQKAQMKEAQDGMALTYAFDALFIGTTAFRLWKMIGKHSSYFLKAKTTLDVETRINFARKSDQIALAFERTKPSSLKEFFEISRRNLSVLTQKAGRVGTRLLESLPKYQKNFNAEEMTRQLRVAFMREVPNNPIVFLKELDSYGAAIEKKILKLTNRWVTDGGKYSMKDLLENPQVLDDIFSRADDLERAFEPAGEFMKKDLKKIWKLIAKQERYQSVRDKVLAASAHSTELADASENAARRTQNSADNLISDEELFHTPSKDVSNSAEDLLWQRDVRVDAGEGAPNFFARKHFVDMLDEEDILLLFEASGGSGLSKMTRLLGGNVGGELRGSLGGRYQFLRNYFEAKQIIKPVIRTLIDASDPTLGVFLSFGKKTTERMISLEGNAASIKKAKGKGKKPTPVAETPADNGDHLLDELKEFYKKLDAKKLDDASGL